MSREVKPNEDQRIHSESFHCYLVHQDLTEGRSGVEPDLRKERVPPIAPQFRAPRLNFSLDYPVGEFFSASSQLASGRSSMPPLPSPGCVARRSAARRRRRFRRESYWADRCRASATLSPTSRSSASRRRRTAPTGPGGCSPATAPATSSTRPCGAPESRAVPHRVAATTGSSCVGRGSPPRCAARRRPTVRRRTSASAACRYLARGRELLDRVRVILASERSAGMRQLARCGGAAVPRPRPASATAPSRRRRRQAGPDRQLPPEPAEHVHRPADRPMLDAVIARARELASAAV